MKQTKVSLPKTALQNLLKSMQTWVKSLKPNYLKLTEWDDYDSIHLYSNTALEAKKNFVADFCQQIQPSVLWDLGCNQGEYAAEALENKAQQVLGFDIDAATVDKAFAFSSQKNLCFLPLCMNFSDPSPALGWNFQERKSLKQRYNANGLLALALIHHLRIQNNIPLIAILDFLFTLAPQGVIEFVPKSDPKVQTLLHYRKDIFEDYSFEAFLEHIEKKATVVKQQKIPETERSLIWYKVNEN